MSSDLREVPLQTLPDDELERLLRSLPKCDLHCHLDGSMRPETVAELARDPETQALCREYGLSLPPDVSAREMKRLLYPGADCKSLVDYLKAFAYTVAVLQTPAALERAAYELAVDCAAENIRYLEVRYAPLLHVNRLMDGIDVLKAVDRGLDRAEREMKGKLRTAIIVCALRNFDRSLSAYYQGFAKYHGYASDDELAPLVSRESARLTVAAARQAGLARVLAFDLAGPEEDHPPKHHREAFHTIVSNLLNITVHAGEAYGPRSILQAVAHLGAHRIGHGTRVLEEGDDLRDFLVDHRIPVEICLTSNLQTRAVPSLAAHPFKRLLDAEVRACICTDNRLVSDTTLTRELFLAVKTFGLTAEELRRVLLYGFKSGFLPYHERRQILLEAKAELREKGLGWGAYH